MASFRSLKNILENTIADNNSSSPPTSSLIDNFSSLKHVKPLKPPHNHSLTEILGKLHLKVHPIYPTSSSSGDDGCSKPCLRNSDNFSSLNSDSLTEGLGSESLGDADDLKANTDNDSSSYNVGEEKDKLMRERRHSGDSSYYYCKNRRAAGKATFPPPISYIGESGKPAFSFQSYRKDGRFVLKEVKIPAYERLQASREDGRLLISYVQSDDEDDDNDNGGEDDGGEEEQGEMICFGRTAEDEEEEHEAEVGDTSTSPKSESHFALE